MQAYNRCNDWSNINPHSANPKKFQIIYKGKTINPLNTLVTQNNKIKSKTTVKVRGYKQDF